MEHIAFDSNGIGFLYDFQNLSWCVLISSHITSLLFTLFLTCSLQQAVCNPNLSCKLGCRPRPRDFPQLVNDDCVNVLHTIQRLIDSCFRGEDSEDTALLHDAFAPMEKFLLIGANQASTQKLDLLLGWLKSGSLEKALASIYNMPKAASPYSGSYDSDDDQPLSSRPAAKASAARKRRLVDDEPEEDSG